MPRRPRLTPAIADVRRAVREAIESLATDSHGGVQPLLLVGLSGGADSLALAAATAFEAPRAGFRAGAVVVDHQLQAGSDEVAERAADQARGLGLDPVIVRRVQVNAAGDGPEGAARIARRAAFAEVAAETGAIRTLLAHTLDDQAETVLLGLARGSGPDSLAGMRPDVDGLLRPLLGIRREQTRSFCIDSGLDAWQDPHNSDDRFARVRVRVEALPTLERTLGPGVAEALARTAEQLREDAEALDHLALEWAEEIAEHSEAGIALPVAALASQPPALRQRVIRLAVEHEFGSVLSRANTLAVCRLITHWHGQSALDLPGVRVDRGDGRIRFTAAPRDS
ncbi:MAG: tRNA lysidine(34) synthetase TilS [Naasia sp.]